MDSDRPSVSRSGERPVTRWRREHDNNDRSQDFSEPPPTPASRTYSRMERPTSRRGLKTDITEYGISRPPTSGRNVLSRPPSAGLPSRVPTAGSRINTMNSPNLIRMNSGLSRNFIDRPITQQGLAGVRSSSSKGNRLARQIQDKIYYQQLLQKKIQELNQEIETISQEAEKQKNDDDVKEVDTELSDLHNQLTDYNNVLDKMIPGANKKEIEQEMRDLRELNGRGGKIENVSQRREQAERKLTEVNKEIEAKRRIPGKMMESFDSEAYREKLDLQKEIDSLRSEYEQLNAKRNRLEERIAQSPIKQEAFKLYSKIFEAEQKRDKLLGIEKDNSSDAAQRQIIEIERKIADAEQELKQLETDIDEDQTEKQNKQNNSEKKDDIMENFIATFEKNKAKELAKLSRLEEQIVVRLEKISNSINENVDSSILMPDEVEMLQTLMEQNFISKNNGEKSFEELKQDNIKLREISSKLEVLEEKIMNSQADVLDNSEIYDDTDEEKQRNLYGQKEFIEHNQNIDVELEITKKDYTKLKELIEQNEVYRPISILEDKLGKTAFENNLLIDEQNEQFDNTLLMEKLFSLVSEYNTFLINDLKRMIY